MAQEINPFHNQDIICFAAEDWWFHNPHSNFHMMKCFAKDNNRILFVNSVGIRMPDPGDKFFWKRVGNKLKSFLRYFKKAEDNIYVLTPFALPLIQNKEDQVQRINKWLLEMQLGVILGLLKFKKPIIWVTSPPARDVAIALKHKWNTVLIYYCVDNLSKFPGVNHDFLWGLELGIQKEADLSFFVNQGLLEERRAYNRDSQLLSHGVDYEHFANAATAALPVPEDLKDIKRPIIGYIGEIKPLDFKLIHFLAERNPTVSFVFIGDIYAEIKEWGLPSNVYFLGRKEYAVLPNYIQEMVCLCLYYDVKDDFNMYRNPKKLMEYFATGKPIVSVDIPVITQFSGVINIAHSYEEFDKLLNGIMARKVKDVKSSSRMEIASKHTWEEVAVNAGKQILEKIHG